MEEIRAARAHLLRNAFAGLFGDMVGAAPGADIRETGIAPSE